MVAQEARYALGRVASARGSADGIGRDFRPAQILGGVGVLIAALFALAVEVGYVPGTRTDVRGVLDHTVLQAAITDVEFRVGCTLARKKTSAGEACGPCLLTCKCRNRVNPKDPCGAPADCGSLCTAELRTKCVACAADFN